MAFTHAWVNTDPPDTEAANLLGQNLRDLKLDIQQRMAAISGLDADKQNFEPGFAGVIYLANDSGHIYRWDGATWVDITIKFFGPLTNPYTVKNAVAVGNDTHLSVTLTSDLLSQARKVTVLYQAVFPAPTSLGSINGIILRLNGATMLNTKNENANAGDVYTMRLEIVILSPTTEQVIGETTITNIAGSIVGGCGSNGLPAQPTAGGFVIDTQPTGILTNQSSMIVTVL